MKLSIGCPPGPQTLDVARRAEALGYDRIYLYDSAALYEDIWIHLALIARATERIGLGTAVLVPNLRHVMATASAIATIERLAPGRLVCAFGTGYTARHTLGQRPLGWNFTRRYVEQLRGLLRGEVVEIKGRPCEMMHRPELARPRPIEVPILLSAFGPKGVAIAREVADGWMGVFPPPEPFDRAVQMVHGTVLAPGESPTSKRVLEEVGPWMAGAYHAAWESDPASVRSLPGGAEWLKRIESARPEAERHLAVHFGHCTHLNEADRLALAAGGAALPGIGWVGEAEALRARATEAAAAGTTEILYTPAGDDLIGQLESFHAALSPLQGAR